MNDYHPQDADPVSAARLGLVPAGTGYRSLAFAIDVAIWLLLAVPAVMGVVMIATGDRSLLAVILVIAGVVLPSLFGLVQLITHGRRGVTAGKAALRLRSVSASDLGRPGFWRVVLRALVLWASTILLVVVGPALLFASGLWDSERRGRSILDRVGGCWLIDARAGLDPFDAKALRHARRALRDRADDGEDLPSMASGAPESVALRIPDARSRAGVVGPGGTGAQWALARAAEDLGVIDGVPGADAAPAAVEPGATASRDGSPFAPSATAFDAASAAFAPVTTGTPSAPAAAHGAAATSSPPPAEIVQSSAAGPATGLRRAQAMVRFDDGSVVRVPVLGLIGRDPEGSAGESPDALVRLEDPQRLMSKTHASFGQDAEGVWVGDRGSRNGTQLLSPGGDVVDVPAGERMRVPAGWTVQVGGRTFELVARGADS
ncbi:RDD family protein [Microbacterium sp. SSM24]|uniref:RDD family protein n=1 Tax=Microbacterium sp. SSM24 TaxID=2991714 RepID=UPI0022280771|nr:RDD family protein [Microbacterium sp. SSM24]MCW3492375.1 RDD family protein [Microbacterium sp. SSM24]